MEAILDQPRATSAGSEPDGAPDSALLSLLMMASFHSVAADPDQLRHEFGHASFDGQTLLLAAKKLGLSAKRVRQPVERLDRAPLPAIAADSSGRSFILAKFDAGAGSADAADASARARVLIQRPGEPPMVAPLAEFLSIWTGELVFFTSKASFAGDMARFDFTWFIPAIVKYRKLLGEILLISLVLQIIGLVTPMFFQVVMDKVLVNHALKTLNVIAIGLISAMVFEAVLTGIRTWVFAHTSSKIDVELGARLFRHLLNLPLGYF